MNTKRIIEFFFGSKSDPGLGIRKLTSSFFAAKISVRIIYLYAAAVFYSTLSSPRLFGQIPLQGFPGISYPLGLLPEHAHYILMFISPTGLVAAFLFPRSRTLRCLAFASVFYIEALRWAHTANSHDRLTLIWILFAFCFLPNPSKNPKSANSRQYQLHYLTAYWFSTALFLLSYTTSGLWKLAHEIRSYFETESISIFNPHALPVILDRYSTTTKHFFLWTEFLTNYKWVSFLIFVPIVLAQASAFIPLLFPRLFFLYGIIFSMFHICSLFVISIPFGNHIFLCGLLLILSPFAPNSFWDKLFVEFRLK